MPILLIILETDLFKLRCLPSVFPIPLSNPCLSDAFLTHDFIENFFWVHICNIFYCVYYLYVRYALTMHVIISSATIVFIRFYTIFIYPSNSALRGCNVSKIVPVRPIITFKENETFNRLKFTDATC